MPGRRVSPFESFAFQSSSGGGARCMRLARLRETDRSDSVHVNLRNLEIWRYSRSGQIKLPATATSKWLNLCWRRGTARLSRCRLRWDLGRSRLARNGRLRLNDRRRGSPRGVRTICRWPRNSSSPCWPRRSGRWWGQWWCCRDLGRRQELQTIGSRHEDRT
jgi:hypothetical protein